ncbi:39S ribosomal protein L47 [Mactra antiquata]
MDILRLGCGRLVPLVRILRRIQSADCNVYRSHLTKPLSSQIHTSCVVHDLNEFFDMDSLDDSKVRVGRPWRKDELRIKSNQDLHKLWYVLLKERNQLMTMEAMFHAQNQPLQNPERFEKVEESMENLLDVIKERNDAFEMYEFGETSEPKTYVTRNFVGLPYRRTEKEHYVPKHLNERFNKMHLNHQPWMNRHLAKYEEKYRVKRRQKDKKHRKNRINIAEEFELSQEELDELIEKQADHTGDVLDEYLELSAELNDIPSK